MLETQKKALSLFFFLDKLPLLFQGFVHLSLLEVLLISLCSLGEGVHIVSFVQCYQLYCGTRLALA